MTNTSMTPPPPDETDSDGGDRPGPDSHPRPRTVRMLRASIRETLGVEPEKSTALRRDELRSVYEWLTGRALDEYATVAETRFRITEVLAGVESRSRFDSAYAFRRDELIEIDRQLRESDDKRPPDMTSDTETEPDTDTDTETDTETEG